MSAPLSRRIRAMRFACPPAIREHRLRSAVQPRRAALSDPGARRKCEFRKLRNPGVLSATQLQYFPPEFDQLVPTNARPSTENSELSVSPSGPFPARAL